MTNTTAVFAYRRFQFLGIPPKGERYAEQFFMTIDHRCFQFLGIPPKGEQILG